MHALSRRALLRSAITLPFVRERSFVLSKSDDAFLNDICQRAFRYFWEQSNPANGLVLDRARTDGGPVPGRNLEVASTALTGFYLTALCIAAERRWRALPDIRQRVLAALSHFLHDQENVLGWFYHFVDRRTGNRVWNSEVSSIDTAVLLAGVITVQQYFAGDREIYNAATRLYQGVDFSWMLDRGTGWLRMGWRPESGFLRAEWTNLDENAILTILAIASPTTPVPPEIWYRFQRDPIELLGYRFFGRGPIFTHQYSQAWLLFRNLLDGPPFEIDYFRNSVVATYAFRSLCLSLRGIYPGFSENLWGISPSDSDIGYVIWGSPLSRRDLDGTVVPCAAAGSLMFAPEICLAVLRYAHAQFGDRVYGPYGFADSFNPLSGWVNPDVVGVDQGITLLSGENLRSGNVWRWFGRSADIRRAMRQIFEPY